MWVVALRCLHGRGGGPRRRRGTWDGDAVSPGEAEEESRGAGERVQSLDGVLRLHGGGGQTPGVERGSLFDAYVVAVRLIGGVC